MNALVIPLSLQTRDFRTNAEAARQDMQRLQSEVANVDAELKANQREARASGSATEAQVTQIKELQKALKGLNADLRTAKAEYTAFSAVPAPEIPAHGPSAPDDSARYEAYWRKKEEEDRSQRAHEAMAAVPVPEAPEMVKITRQTVLGGNSTVSTTSPPVKVTLPPDERPASARAGSPKAAGKPESSDEEDDEHGSTRMRDQELSHVIRSLSDSVGAGQSLGKAFQMEAPRIFQAAGLGLGAMIGAEVAGAIAKMISEGISGRKVEQARYSEELSGNGGGVGTSSSGALSAQIQELQKAAQERLDATGNGAPGHDSNIFDFVGRQGKNAWRAAMGQPSVDDETDDKIVGLEERRNFLSAELAKRKQEQIDLDKRAFRDGEELVAIDRTRLLYKEKRAEILDNTSIDATAGARMIDSLKQEENLQISLKQIELDRKENQRLMRREEAQIAHPKSIKDDGSENLLNIPDGSIPNTPALARAQAHRDKAVNDRETLKRQGKDARDADLDVLDAENELRNLAVDEEMKTPAQRRKDARQLQKRQEAEARLQSRSDRAEFNYKANSTRGQFDDFFGGNRHMPDRSFSHGDVPSLPNRRVGGGEKKASSDYMSGLQKHNAEMLSVLKSIEGKVTYQEQ